MAGFPAKNAADIRKADWYRSQFEGLLREVVAFADHILREANHYLRLLGFPVVKIEGAVDEKLGLNRCSNILGLIEYVQTIVFKNKIRYTEKNKCSGFFLVILLPRLNI